MGWISSSPEVWLRFVVAALATWRIAYAFTVELGPFDVFKRLREFAKVDHLREDGWPVTNLGRLLDCIKCFSIWSGLLCAILMFTPLWVAMTPFALSAVAIFIKERIVEYE